MVAYDKITVNCDKKPVNGAHSAKKAAFESLSGLDV